MSWHFGAVAVFVGVACGSVDRDDAPSSATGDSSHATTPAVCGNATCAPEEECCYSTGDCAAIGSDACPKPTADIPDHVPCAADSHCGPGEYCNVGIERYCMGAGYCASRTNCPTCTGDPSGEIPEQCKVCGCDGVTYAAPQTACAAGVRIVWFGDCGPVQVESPAGFVPVATCGVSSPCADGQTCCALTGMCYEAPAEDWLCAFPPEGTTYPCLDDAQCLYYQYCKSDSCGAPGGCVQRASECAPELEPVCGCDGKDYVNATCAASVGVNIAHSGTCAP